jgi:hypothetical protein
MTVIFSDQAVAFAGAPQELEGIGILRAVPAAMNGPPRGPFAPRVSITRQGATVISCKAPAFPLPVA